MKFSWPLWLFFLGTTPLLAQTKHTVSGILIDAATSEQLIGATIVVEGTTTGTITNAYGYFSLTLPAAPVSLRMSYTGYSNSLRTVDLSVADVNLGSVKLESAGTLMQEVTVRASADRFRKHVSSTQMGTIDVPLTMLKKAPAIAGEVDIIKALQLTPGVKRGAEGTIGMYVRGGGADQNLILLDEATVYNAGHLLGFFSVFNSNALKDVQLYKSSFPAEYGGRLSSIMDVRMKEGNLHKFGGEGSLGLISSNLTLEGPLAKDRSSFVVSGRRTYLDVVTFGQVPYHFYDLIAKLNYKLDERNRLYISGYKGDDILSISEDESRQDQSTGRVKSSITLGNTTGSLRWNHFFKDPRLFSNFSVQYTRFRYNIEGILGENSLLIASSIRDVGAKADLSFAPDARQNLHFGGTLTNHQFRPNIINTTGTISDAQRNEPGKELNNNEFALYASNDHQLTSRLQLNYGLRLTGLVVPSHVYTNLEPRVAGRYLINDRNSVKLSYARMAQYMHLVGSSSLTLPTDLWYPVTTNVKPGLSDQVSAGYYYTIPDWNISLSVEAYYKWLQNQIEYREGAQLLLNNDYEKELVTGKGRSYGIELFATKTAGRFTGWFGYSLSYAKRQFDELNGGREYYAKYDRRHDFSFVGSVDLTKRKTLALNVVYATGSPFTAQTGQFISPSPTFTSYDVLPVYGPRNANRLSASFRVDIDYGYKFSLFKKIQTEFHASVYNLLNRTQPSRVERSVDVGTLAAEFKQEGLFGAIPTISFNFKF